MSSTSPIIPPQVVREQREEKSRAATDAATPRNAAELAIVTAIAQLAQAHDALEDLAAIQDVTIPSLTALATQKGVTSAEWNSLITTITPMKWQLEALVGGTWQECWEGLKGRFASYLESLQQSNQ